MFLRVEKLSQEHQVGATLILKQRRCPRKLVSVLKSVLHSHNPTIFSYKLEATKEAPETEFQIEHVYGYRAADCQQNLRYTAEGKAVYMVAALGVVMDTNTCEQKFYGG